MAGLLPDPDVSYTPSDWNSYVWVVSLVFETAFLALFVSRCHGRLPVRSTDTDASNTPEETERLLNRNMAPNRENGYGSTPNKSKGVLEARVGDAQTTTWLDYVVGFKNLFPFLW